MQPPTCLGLGRLSENHSSKGLMTCGHKKERGSEDSCKWQGSNSWTSKLAWVLSSKRKFWLLPHKPQRLSPTSSHSSGVRGRAGVREAQIRQLSPGTCLWWVASEYPCFPALPFLLKTLSHHFCKEWVLSQANALQESSVSLLLSWKSGHLSGESTALEWRPPRRGCQDLSIVQECQRG